MVGIEAIVGGTLSIEMRGLSLLGVRDRSLGSAPGREEDLKNGNPLGVALSGRDHAGAYVYLASEKSRGATGTVLHSDGGIGIKG